MKKQEGFQGQISHVIPEKIINIIGENPLISDLYLTDIGYYPDAKHHFRKRAQGINKNILIYNIKGTGLITLHNKEFTIPPDHYFIIPKNTPHTYSANSKDSWTIYWIHFSGSKAHLFIPKTIESIKIERGTSSRINERIKLFNDIFKNVERGFSNETLEYINLCLNYLLSSFTHVNQFRTLNNFSKKDFVSEGINYMLENINQKLQVKDFATMFNLSSSHFSRVFTNQTGHSPINYFIQLKVQAACKLLDNTDMSINDISHKMGFDNPFYFSRIFKKLMNMAPRDYRKR
jgi:AraC family transcriptional regulator of arabinose operon